jgi:DNA-binding transcriptional MerR regulator
MAPLTIGTLAKATASNVETIRYYERIGLLPYADRDQSGQRDYDASILVWIEFLHRMKTTGMPIREMLRYAALREGGAETETERRALLEQQRARVRTHLGELQDCLLVLDAKIAGYSGVKKRMKVYDAIALGRERKPAGTRQAGTRSD